MNKKILLPFLLVLSLTACNKASPSSSLGSSDEEISESDFSSEEPSSEESSLEEYYSSVNFADASSLADSLQTLMFSTHTTYTSYAELKTYLPKSDKKPDDDSKMISFYSKQEMNAEWGDGKTWNREHVWPKSKSHGAFDNSYGGADIHHIRPTLMSENSSRGNASFGSFVPDDHVRGDCARICMYVFIHYSSNLQGTGVKSSYMGAMMLSDVFTDLNLIKEWNELDPVDNLEEQRNEYAYEIQGNRNPFIDHPEWVNTIVDSYL